MIRRLLAERSERRRAAAASAQPNRSDETDTPTGATITSLIEARSAFDLMTLLLSAGDAVRRGHDDWWYEPGVSAAAKVLYFDLGQRLEPRQGARPDVVQPVVLPSKGTP